ncbi:MAG: ribbon-helix-helix protein, CopG family [Terriglobia bacterium]
MKKLSKGTESVSAEAIARQADQGKDISRFFTNRGRMVKLVQRVNVDFAPPMLEELDRAAEELNISRQALIKTLVRQALDRHYMAMGARLKR